MFAGSSFLDYQKIGSGSYFCGYGGNIRARRTRQPYLELGRAEYVPVPPKVFGLVAPVAISHTVRWIPVPNGLTSTSARTDHRRSTNALASWASGSRRRWVAYPEPLIRSGRQALEGFWRSSEQADLVPRDGKARFPRRSGLANTINLRVSGGRFVLTEAWKCWQKRLHGFSTGGVVRCEYVYGLIRGFLVM